MKQRRPRGANSANNTLRKGSACSSVPYCSRYGAYLNDSGKERPHLGMILDAKAHSQNRGSKRQMYKKHRVTQQDPFKG